MRSLRPAQWSKNLFVLAPLLFARRLGDPVALRDAALAFAAFSAAASASYLLNDLRDREQDRLHPLKRRRPIASGALGAGTAFGAALVVFGATFALGAKLGHAFLPVLGVYLALSVLYTLLLKRLVILDVMALSLGFVLRVLGGAAAIGVAVSHWLLLCTSFLALFLGFSKRRHELLLLDTAASSQRSVLSQYTPAFLDQMINVVTASAVVSYALYAVAPETIAKFQTDRLLLTLPMVLFGIFRYLYLMHRPNELRNPTEAILRDLPFLANILLWAVAAAMIVHAI